MIKKSNQTTTVEEVEVVKEGPGLGSLLDMLEADPKAAAEGLNESEIGKLREAVKKRVEANKPKPATQYHTRYEKNWSRRNGSE